LIVINCILACLMIYYLLLSLSIAAFISFDKYSMIDNETTRFSNSWRRSAARVIGTLFMTLSTKLCENLSICISFRRDESHYCKVRCLMMRSTCEKKISHSTFIRLRSSNWSLCINLIFRSIDDIIRRWLLCAIIFFSLSNFLEYLRSFLAQVAT